MGKRTRRSVLAGVGAALTGSVAGCNSNKAENQKSTQETGDTETLAETATKLEQTENDGKEADADDTERTIKDAAIQIGNQLRDIGYDDRHITRLFDQEDDKPSVTIDLGLEQVFDQTPLGFENQNIKYINQVGKTDKLIKDISVPLTDIMVAAASNLEGLEDDYEHSSILIRGEGDTNIGFIYEPEELNQAFNQIQQATESNSSPSARVEDISKNNVSVGWHGDTYDSRTFVSMGGSKDVNVNGEDYEILIGSAKDETTYIRVEQDGEVVDSDTYEEGDEIGVLDDSIVVVDVDPIPDYEHGIAIDYNCIESQTSLKTGVSDLVESGNQYYEVELNAINGDRVFLSIDDGAIEGYERGEEFQIGESTYSVDSAIELQDHRGHAVIEKKGSC